MSRMSMRSKRSIAKMSPLSKRPRLEFSPKEGSPRNRKNYSTSTTTEVGSPEELVKRSPKGIDHFAEKRQNDQRTLESDWDDEFSGEVLEKVCLIADLSQAMANNQPLPEKLEKAKTRLFDGNKRSDNFGSRSMDPNIELEDLKLEFQELQEKFKTKEGEVHILRSQLKQNEDSKQAVALQNIKAIDDVHKKYNEKLCVTEKELETVKTKLQFRDMEYKTLVEKCRQLEYCVYKSKKEDCHEGAQVDTSKTFGAFSPTQAGQTQKLDNEPTSLETPLLLTSKIEWPTFDVHEGRQLERNLCPEIFQFAEEPNIVQYYTSKKGSKSKLDFSKMKKYEWSDLPKPKIFLKDLYDFISSLFIEENFHRKEIKKRVEEIMDSCWKILNYYKEVLLYVEKLNIHHCEHDDSDQFLLENEDEVKLLTIKTLLGGEKLNEEECGIEGRRTLALIYILISTSQIACDFMIERPEMIETLKILAETIGNLRRPLRYTGILGAMTFVLRRLLLENSLDEKILFIINGIVEEIIFARPKLDVLTEVVRVLASGRRHFEFMARLCRKASLDSCSLYMDSKLKQAMFFTKNACPLKLLCMQIMGLARLSSSLSIRIDLTASVIDWLNSSINTIYHKSIKWLPTNSLLNEEESCFDVTECLIYLLILCLKDYLSRFRVSGEKFEFPSREVAVEERKHEKSISIIGRGVVLLKRILKTDQRQLNDNSYSLRFAILLRYLTILKSDIFQIDQSYSRESDAIAWLAEPFENDPRNQDCYLRHKTSAIPESEMLNALKIDDESKIY